MSTEERDIYLTSLGKEQCEQIHEAALQILQRTGVAFQNPRALEILQATCRELGAKEVHGDTDIAKISLVGVGMRSHAGIASQMFAALAKERINIQMISTSEIKISVVVAQKYLELGVRALHETFELGQEPVAE